MKKRSISRTLQILVIYALLITSCDFPGFGQKPACGESVLTIDEAVYRIKETTTKSDGSLKISSNTPDIAYWVDQTETNQVFALSPAPENRALGNTNPEQAVVRWANCNSSEYTLSVPQAGAPDINTLLDQSFSGITILVLDGNDSFVIHGEFIGEEIQEFSTPDPSEVQAEISLIETTASPDGATVGIGVSIQNYGGSPFTLTVNDVILTSPDGTPQVPTMSEPSLPREIGAGALETFQFTFPRPASPTAVLKILGVEYDIEGY